MKKQVNKDASENIEEKAAPKVVSKKVAAKAVQEPIKTKIPSKPATVKPVAKKAIKTNKKEQEEIKATSSKKAAVKTPPPHVKLEDIKVPLKTVKEEMDVFGEKANKLFNSLLVKMGADKEKLFTTLREEGTQVLSDMLADAIVDPKFKNISDIKSSDLTTLLKKHTMQKLFNVGRAALTGTISSTVKEKMGAKVNTNTVKKIDDKTTFVEFIHYMLDNPAYKGSPASSAVVAFIASQSTVNDIVVGRASKWETVVAQVKMFESSELDKATTHKLNVQLIENFFGEDLANNFDEHFSSDSSIKPQSKKARP